MTRVVLDVCREAAVTIHQWEEADVPVPPGVADRSLRLLARWLVKTAMASQRVTAPDPDKPLDVAADPKVGLDGK